MQYNLVFSTDNTYLHYMFVLCQSVVDNLKVRNTASPDEIVFNILTDNSIDLIAAQNKSEQFLQQNHRYDVRCRFEWLVVDVNKFSSFSKMTRENKVSFSTYYRLIIDQLLPTDVNYAAYLDVDMLVLGDIRNLFDQHKLEGKVLGAVLDIGISYIEDGKEEQDYIYDYYKADPTKFIKISKLHYFNAGMLLINLQEWRKQQITQKSLECAQTIELRYHDQDILNHVCKDRVELLDLSWNFQNPIFYLLYNENSGCYDTIHMFAQNVHLMSNLTEASYFEKCYSHPQILHYTSFKPWHALYKGHQLVNDGPTIQASPAVKRSVDLWLKTEERLNMPSDNFHIATSDAISFNTRYFNKMFHRISRDSQRFFIISVLMLAFSFINFVIHFFA